MDKRYESWSKARRFEAAVTKVLDEGWTQTEAAERYGVSRQNLSPKVKKAKVARAEKVEAAKREKDELASKLVLLGERRRIPDTLDGFIDTYFTNWQCPDCRTHHEVPGFHTEISEAIRSPKNRRVVVNIPPYHSKSTVVTVWDTIMDIAEDPNLRTIIVSKSTPFARTFVHSISEILTNPELYADSKRNLIEDFGPFKPEGQATWNSTELYVAGRTSAEKDPTVLAMGVGTQIYGRRGDKLKFDDVATLENQRNPDRVAGMMEWIDKEALSRIGKTGRAIWVGTRVHPGDIYLPLSQRPGYVVIRYPALLDDEREEVLWPEHFPYSQVLIHRSEMKPADFQLVYQNVDVPGLGASFTQEMLDECKDTSRVVGHYDTRWRLIAGLDPAGGNKGSGFTAFTLIGIDLETGKRFLVDQYAEKSMKAPAIKDKILQWSDMYPLFEWRVESNGLQSQLVQYNLEVVQALAKRGIRVTPHHTHTNKWDPQFGVESIAPLMAAGMFSIPWGNAPSARAFQPFIEEAVAFPMGLVSDRIMSTWFADLGARDLMSRAHLPMFNSRMRVPARVKRRRRVVDFQNQDIRHVPLRDQRPGHMTRGQWGYRRMTTGLPSAHDDVEEYDEPAQTQPSNIDPRIWAPQR